MKKLLRETFEKVYCINLDSRPDKWDTCEQEFKKYGISDVVERWSGTQLPTKTHRAGARGCLASHLNIIKQCISDKTSNVLILEDDFEFLHYGLDYYNKTRKRIETDPREILQLALKQLSDVQWDLFYLGYNIKLKQFCNKKILSENLFQATGMLTTASYALTIDMCKRIYDDFCELEDKESARSREPLKQEDLGCPANLATIAKSSNIDTYLAYYLSPKVQAINIFPMIVGQRGNLLSDISDKVQSNSWCKSNGFYNWMEYV